ncbi:14122_t:CDS:2 [Ambispora leptoticha]|uniref:14122_t:CDS:1 n=1 Tax=Ambispora leptoticha TaxID=144679 RepID=A0A9N9BD71_9GLOM|nr:14122_t:CDS:2 [Ambispora leptoticha]
MVSIQSTLAIFIFLFTLAIASPILQYRQGNDFQDPRPSTGNIGGGASTQTTGSEFGGKPQAE